jgi:hypothetical protein
VDTDFDYTREHDVRRAEIEFAILRLDYVVQRSGNNDQVGGSGRG